MVNFRLMAARNCGMISSPDCTAVYPRPTWYSSGRRNGIPPAPRRVTKLPITATRKVRVRNRPNRSTGWEACDAWCQYASSRATANASNPVISSTLSVCSPKISRT